ncbi:amidohydrolase family protein [Maribellus comscasis]|uniref:Amidohydrolase family protein n=1 Tax=Maribellus comscasis TaxID=2681766 RepID=A0A6I6JMZ3_9BACT|nr:amidohydrolase family protein [Maribellus comscasis]QGY43801.1 amidohydrolase family protein [Maribellus comscasis]
MKRKSHFLLLITIVFFACENKYYSVDNFPEVEKIDAHYHIYTNNNSSLEQAANDNFKLFAINTYSGGCERVVTAHQWLKELGEEKPDEFAYSATFCLDGWDDSAWVDNTISWIEQCVADGANSVKVWKNIGMEYRDKDSALIMIDDPKFDPIFEYLAKNNIPLVGHLGEPKNCWLPADEMTTKNDSGYFSRHPEYHMYLHPEFPSYEEQMAARDRMLEKNPDLVFIGCHLASLEWSVDTLAEFLDRFPNASVDMAARLGQVFYQTRDDRDKVRKFFVDYQDRLMYGTDVIDSGQEKEAFQEELHQTWLLDWEFLVTDKTMSSSLIDGDFQGLKLPKEVINKIYSENFKKWYKTF